MVVVIDRFQRLLHVSSLMMLLLLCCSTLQAQITTGTVHGVVKDQTGGVVPNARVTITESKTKNAQTFQTGSGGEFQFNNLLVGDYSVAVEPPESSNFGKLIINDVRVQLNQVTDLTAVVQPAEQQAAVTVSAGGVELVDTTSINLSKDFSSQ